MKIEIYKYELKILAITSIGLAVLIGWSQLDTSDMRKELDCIGQEKLAEYLGNESPDKYETIILIDGGKSFHLFGRAWAVIHVYIRDKGDEEMKTFKGLEYYLKRYDGKWCQIDSAGCGALEHHIRAFKEFEAKGMKVSPSVYARLNK